MLIFVSFLIMRWYIPNDSLVQRHILSPWSFNLFDLVVREQRFLALIETKVVVPLYTLLSSWQYMQETLLHSHRFYIEKRPLHQCDACLSPCQYKRCLANQFFANLLTPRMLSCLWCLSVLELPPYTTPESNLTASSVLALCNRENKFHY